MLLCLLPVVMVSQLLPSFAESTYVSLLLSLVVLLPIPMMAMLVYRVLSNAMDSEPDADGHSMDHEKGDGIGNDEGGRHQMVGSNSRHSEESLLKSALSMFFRDDKDGGDKTEKLMAIANDLKRAPMEQTVKGGTVCNGDGETEAGAATAGHAQDDTLELSDLGNVLIVLDELEAEDISTAV